MIAAPLPSIKRSIWVSHAGLADNPSISPEAIADLERELAGDSAQLAARMHGLFAQPSGIAIKFDPNRDFETWTPEMRLTVIEKKWGHVCGVDFGFWRFAFVHLVIDRAGRGHVVYEKFSQKEGLEARAKYIHDHLTLWQAPDNTRIWGDTANPTDILELNKELVRIKSKYRVAAVAAENKAREASVQLVNSLIVRQALVFSRQLGEGQIWRLGQNAAKEGTPQMGSRLKYEIGQWRYAQPKDGEPQSKEIDDATADGADLVAALRYAVMSHFRPADFDTPKPKRKPNQTDRLVRVMKKLNEQHSKLNGGRNGNR